MKRFTIKQLYSVLFIFLIAFVLSCSTSTESENVEFTTLVNYLVDHDMDIPDILTDWIVPASAIKDNLSDYYIIDIRSAADYQSGHIPGAVNSTLPDVLTTAQNNTAGKPIIVVCYTGQSAAHAVVALRLSGYRDAKVLKWGMSGWNSDFDKWTPNCKDVAVNHPNWTTDPPATPKEHDKPILNTGKKDGADILKARVQALLSGGFQGIDAQTVLDNPDNYFINNYWPETAWNQYGHIKGAYRLYDNFSLANGSYKYLDPDATIVTYCWTGQTSSMITAYLTVLGYTAKSLKFGANGMIYSRLESHKWSGSADYQYEK